MMFNDSVGASRKPSFDGGDSVAELEAWMSGGGDGDSVAFTVDQNDVGRVDEERQSGGPIDLDEEYERRFDSNRNESGWREGRHETLEGIAEAKTAADLYLESALGMSSTASSILRQQQKSNPVRSPASDGGANNAFIRKTRSKSSFKSPSPTKRLDNEEARRLGIDTSGSEKRVRAAGRRTIPDQAAYNEEVDLDNNSEDNNNSFLPRQYQSGPQPMTEEALRSLDNRNAPPRGGASMNFRGYTGFLDKTKDVPNLMDDESVASTSLDTAAHSVDGRNASMGLVLPSITETSRGTTLRPSPPSSNFDSGSDIFDGVHSSTGSIRQSASHRDDFFRRPEKSRNSFPHHSIGSTHQSFDRFPDDQFEPFSTQFNPFASHRGSSGTNSTRSGADFLDPTLDISSLNAEDSEADYGSVPDLSMYCVEPDLVRKMVRAFRKNCTSQMEINSSNDMLSEFESLVDTKKAFALFEMRSRIMETDIDRGLERRGGTNVADDIVLTPYFQAAHRVRDAVIVSKAWRDGATPKDVVTAHLLTRRSAKAYSVPRLIERIRRPGNPFYKQYWLEEVHWLDDTDFMMMRCQSLEAGTMKGFEMFTIGDCQSILLKMTSDNATVSTCL